MAHQVIFTNLGGPKNMEEYPKLMMLQTCPFCWKVRSLLEHLNIDFQESQLNPLRRKKALKFAGDWGKVPIWRESEEDFIVDSTPIMIYLDNKYNDSKLSDSTSERQKNWLKWVDEKLSKATIPILYGSIGSALSSTRSVSKLEKFGFFSRHLYAWTGFPIMWGIIDKTRVKKDGTKQKQLWHDLLDELIAEFNGKQFFGGESPDIVDIAAFGIVRSISPFKQFKEIESHESGMNW
ncbi:MAG: glutathione S-transferase, partial [Candidatus Thermoplasmatota archaeon]|nr:glutathione S-transferase [Candidatus Thermoplasmatota archaeon]